MKGAIRGTCREKIYHKLGFESLQYRRWYIKLCAFYKILISLSPKYLSDIIPSITRSYALRNAKNIPLVRVFNNYFMNTNLTWVSEIQLALIYLKTDYYNLQNL